MFITVNGSTHTEVNGLYGENGEVNGKLSFYLNDGTDQRVEWNGSSWEIRASDNSIIFESAEDVATPDLVQTWIDHGTSNASDTNVEITEFPFLRIKGAGVAKVNACYSAYDIANVKPKYGLVGTHPVEDSVYIQFTGDAWEIYGAGYTVPQYYFSYDDVETPDLVTTWEKDKDGVLPLPTFVLGCVKFIPSSSKAVKRN